MNIIKEADFRKEIKTSPRAAYLFFGEEDYMKGFALKTAREAICPDPTFAFFNEMKLDALSYSPNALLEAMMPLPMAADRKLITVTDLDISTMKSSEIDELCSTLSKLEDYDYNTVIITVSADRFDAGLDPVKRPSKLLSTLSEHLTPVYFDRNSPSKLAAWVGKHYAHNGVKASPEVCAATVDYCGRNMFNLSNETDKISFFVRSCDRDEVTLKDVLAVGISATEYDAFAFTNAIAARRREDALNILRDMKTRRLDPIIIMGEISKTVCDMSTVILLSSDGLTSGEISEITKIHEYRISLMLRNGITPDVCRAMMEKCSVADVEIKTSRDGFLVLERLICTI